MNMQATKSRQFDRHLNLITRRTLPILPLDVFVPSVQLPITVVSKQCTRLNFFPAFSTAASIAFFHGAEYLERNKITESDPTTGPFYPSWPAVSTVFSCLSKGYQVTLFKTLNSFLRASC